MPAENSNSTDVVDHAARATTLFVQMVAAIPIVLALVVVYRSMYGPGSMAMITITFGSMWFYCWTGTRLVREASKLDNDLKDLAWVLGLVLFIFMFFLLSL